MSYVASHTTTHNTVPRGLVHRVEFSLNYLCDVVQNALLLEGECHAVNCVLLHGFAHVGELDNSVGGVLLVDVAVGLHILRVFFGSPLLLVVFGLGLFDCELRRYTTHYFLSV